MDYVDAASQLGEAIVNSAAFITLKNAELALMQDEKAQTLMSDFRQLQSEMVRASREDDSKTNRAQRIQRYKRLFRRQERFRIYDENNQ